jgi:hypothetical protein
VSFKEGQIIYFQGRWACRVVKDHGDSVFYIPLEGYATGQAGKEFSAASSLFKKKREHAA